MKRLTFISALIISSLTTSFACAKEQDKRGDNRQRMEKFGFIYGAGIGIDNGIYKDHDQPVIPLPIIGYRGEKFSVFGPFVSYHAWRGEHFKLSLNAAPRFGGYEADDADIFEGMDERKLSLDAGIGLTYQHNDWKIDTSIMRDVLGKSDGLEVKSTFGKMMRFGPVFVEPSVGLSYVDSNHVDYYYGVAAHEVTANRMQYTGDSALNKTLGVSVMTPIFFGGITSINIENTWFDDNISDSPLTDGDSSLAIRLMFSKFF
ncbi:MAG: MipA/OmpV family protein [Psychrobium sp.]